MMKMMRDLHLLLLRKFDKSKEFKINSLEIEIFFNLRLEIRDKGECGS
jgi:hypothetical protein